jgi:HPt (histidine-containing phosphotransfer) domain-containing protein
MTEQEIIDRAAFTTLLDMLGGDTAFLGEMIDEFFNDTPTLLADMRQALRTKDAVVLRRAAHTLKSNSANFGALALSAQCKALEELSRAGTLDDAPTLVAQIEAAYEQARRALQAARPEG